MSYYFADKPEYFNFLQALEIENDKYRELHQMYAKLAKKSDDEYKNTQSHIINVLNTIKPPVRNREPRTIPNSPTRRKPNLRIKKRCDTSFAISPNYNGQVWTPGNRLPNAMPARSNNAKRIYEPAKLKRYEKERKQPVLLVGTSLKTEVKTPPPQPQRKRYAPSLKSNFFDEIPQN